QAAGRTGEQVRRRADRHRQPGGGNRRNARYHRGRHRALPDPAGLHDAHTAWPRGDFSRIPASGAAGQHRAERQTGSVQQQHTIITAMDENFACQVQVFYEDTDAGGVVYHANYLRYCERARSLWLEAQGLTHGRLAAQYGIGFVVTHADVRFRAPARLDDRLQVTVSIERRRRASLLFAQSIRRGPEMLVSARI